MNFKYLVSTLALSTGLLFFADTASGDVIVEWQPGDNSANIQKAIDSGDDTVVVPNVGKPWIVSDRILARKANQTIIFEPGVLVLAEEGGFQKKNTSILMIQTDNVTVSGYGATFQMRKEDYQNPELYEPSQFRHALVVRGSEGFVVEGLTFKDAGGDGLFISHGRKSSPEEIPERKFSSGIIRDVVSDNNYRLGLSIMSAKNLTVENSVFKNTSGVRPASGVDIEPDHGWQKLVNIKFKNNKFINNDRNGIQIGLGKYRGEDTEPISIFFDGCETIDNDEVGIKINVNRAKVYDGAKGKINFKNCDIAGSGEHGIHLKSDHINPEETLSISFEDTTVKNTASNIEESFPVTLLNTRAPGVFSNVDFGDNFVIYDDANRPGLFFSNYSLEQGMANIHGKVKIENPQQQPSLLGDNLENVTLEIVQ